MFAALREELRQRVEASREAYGQAQPPAGNAAILRPRGVEVQPVLRPPPETLTLENVRTYQVHLASKCVAWASLNQTAAALRFFHGVTLGMAEMRTTRVSHPV